LDREFATRPLADWGKLFDDAELTYGVVQTVEETANDAQLKANRVLVPVEDSGTRRYHTIDSPVRLDQEQKVPAGPAPDLGQHTDVVLGELGFDATGIENLRTAGAIPRR
jgi:crotonobetainyl-CoA:carnitine CoA-transferase CaiB-like acyl-CoA transferase